MEEVLLNIDSKYRDITLYPNESKFTYNLDKIYKNIVSIKLASIEINNSSNIVDSKKNNNYFQLYLPNKMNDNVGITVRLENGLIQSIDQITDSFNTIFNESVNSNDTLKIQSPERYFYFFYSNTDLTITFDFNNNSLPTSLQTPLILKKGWMSVYGMVRQICNYILEKYNARKAYVVNNPSSPSISLDVGNYVMNGYTIPVYDRRFRHNSELSSDCIRYDSILSCVMINSDLNTNFTLMKNIIYRYYLRDITTFTPSTYYDNNNGILDNLNCGRYYIGPGYDLSGQFLESNSIYHINNTASYPSVISSQIYNITMAPNLSSLLLSINNNLTKSSYYYVAPQLYTQTQTWDNSNNSMTNLLNKTYLLNEQFITYAQYSDPSYHATLEKDTPTFEIDFSTASQNNINSNKTYPPIGFYLGYRPNPIQSIPYTLSASYNSVTNTMEIQATKVFNVTGNSYIFLRINDWGYYDMFNQKVFCKVLLTSGLGNRTLGYGHYILSDYYANTIYNFRQPTNVKRLDIELVDYLGNTVDLNGVDYSITLQLCETYSSDMKVMQERNALVFCAK